MRSFVFTALKRLAVLLSCTACMDGPTINAAPRLVISVEPRMATVIQGDSSELVAVVSSNFELVTDPQVSIIGAPTGVSVRVARIDKGTTVASAVLVVVVGPTAVPGTYELQLLAINATHQSPLAGFTLTVESRPDCSQASPCVQWATTATASSQYTTGEWSAMQATGAPNVNRCDDNTSAWAAAAPNTVEWLEVQFSEAMIPVGLKIYENYGASSIVSIEVKDEAGAYRTVYTSTPGLLSCPSNRTIPLTDVNVTVKAVRLNIDQRTLGDWNEVDAVGLVGYRVK
jgi:hypothetical protein